VDSFSAIKTVTVPSGAPVLGAAGPNATFRITATWSLPPTVVNDFIEIAKKRDVHPDGPRKGGFLEQNVVLTDFALDPQATTYTSKAAYSPGTYYVHVASLPSDDCYSLAYPTCLDEYSATIPVTIPGPDGPPRPLVDKVTAFTALAVRGKQDVDKLFVRAAIGEAGTITASGTVSVPNLSKVYKLATASAKAAAGSTVTLRLKLARKARKAAKRALRRHRRVKAKVTITAKDLAGNVAIQRRTIRLTN
jgi:hypothetical protein